MVLSLFYYLSIFQPFALASAASLVIYCAGKIKEPNSLGRNQDPAQSNCRSIESVPITDSSPRIKTILFHDPPHFILPREFDHGIQPPRLLNGNVTPI